MKPENKVLEQFTFISLSNRKCDTGDTAPFFFFLPLVAMNICKQVYLKN